jgi:CRP-like cAMP-binding protein
MTLLFDHQPLFPADFEKSYSAGQILFLEGDECTHIGFVLTGEILIRSTHPDGREFLIQTIKPGQFFGDVLLFAREDRHYLGNVVSLAESRIAFYSPDTFLNLLQSSKAGLNAYLQELSEKAYELKQDLKLLAQPTLRDRILFYLHSESKRQNSSAILLSVTKERLALKLHVARPSLCRELSILQKEGLIRCERKKIHLLK